MAQTKAENAAVGTTAEGTTAAAPTESDLRRQAVAAADKRLREAHRDEWLGFAQQEAQARGVEYKPRPTPEEKAAAELDRLLAEHPELRERLAQG